MSDARHLSRAYLAARLAALETRVALSVEQRRRHDPSTADGFRGLYLSSVDVDRALANAAPQLVALAPETNAFIRRVEEQLDGVDARWAPRLRTVARSFGLDAIDVEVLLAALAPDVDARFERLYGWLHDDVSRRRASVGLALELAGGDPASPHDRWRLSAAGHLVRGGLVEVTDPERPFLTRSLRVPDRVLDHLLGGDRLEPIVAEHQAVVPAHDVDDAVAVAGAMAAGVGLVYLRERPGAAAAAMAVGALSSLGWGALVLDLRRLQTPAAAAALAAAAEREGRFADAAIVAGPIDAIADHGAAIRAFAERPWPVVLHGSPTWDPRWARAVPFVVDAPVVDSGELVALWQTAVDGAAGPGLDHVAAVAQYRLTPEQVVRAAHAARVHASAARRAVTPDDLRAGARAQNAAGLERLARRIAPTAGWDDLVLPSASLAHLQELASRARHRTTVLDEWGMAGGSQKRRGTIGLFAGPPGTGKTMAAEVVARDLGLDLYVINLATVVDKYIGETEKNLERIFGEAEQVNGILFFDEADALFGKRSEVKDARDRYANVEVAYLLQRMEAFEGIAILATNLKANVDEAFARRVDVSVDFPLPDPDDRMRLWRKNLRPTLPQERDIDVDFLARSFELSGGNIRNIAVTAAFVAATAGRSVGMLDLIHGTQREYRKLGRLCVAGEFGPYFSHVESLQ